MRAERVPGVRGLRGDLLPGVRGGRRARRPGSGPDVVPQPRPQRACTALWTAQPQEAVPAEPPASERGRQIAAADLDPDRRPRGTASASAAIWARTVRAPVPMSVALIRIAVACRRRRRAPSAVEGGDQDGVGGGGDAGAQQQSPSRRTAGRGSRGCQPKRSGALPQAVDEVAAAEGAAAVRLGVRFVADPQLDGVHAEGDGEFVHGRLQGVHPGGLARVRASRRGSARRAATTRCTVRLFGEVYMTRAGTAACSTNSLTVEVWVATSCDEGGEDAVGAGAERAPAARWGRGGRRPRASARRGRDEFDRAPGVAGGHRGQDHLGARACPWSRSRRRRARRRR